MICIIGKCVYEILSDSNDAGGDHREQCFGLRILGWRAPELFHDKSPHLTRLWTLLFECGCVHMHVCACVGVGVPKLSNVSVSNMCIKKMKKKSSWGPWKPFSSITNSVVWSGMIFERAAWEAACSKCSFWKQLFANKESGLTDSWSSLFLGVFSISASSGHQRYPLLRRWELTAVAVVCVLGISRLQDLQRNTS